MTFAPQKESSELCMAFWKIINDIWTTKESFRITYGFLQN